MISRPAVTVRDAIPSDAHDVARLLTALGHATDADVVPQRLASVAAEGGAAMLAVDESDGRALGFMSLAKHAVIHAAGPVAWITALVVSEDARGRGVGRALVSAARAWAAARGCVRLTVASGEHRADAHAFYPACGLAYTGRRFATTLEPKAPRS